MADSSQEVKGRLRKIPGSETARNGSGAPDRLPDKVQRDLQADEDDPSRLAPSAEGVVTFAGLTSEVRRWLADELDKVGRNGNGRGPNGSQGPEGGPVH